MMGAKLKLPSCVTRIERNNKVIFFNVDIPSWIVTDQNGAVLLSLCDGTMSKEEIYSLFLEEKGKAEAIKVELFLEQCIQSKLFDLPKEGEIPIRRNSGFLSIVQLSVSPSCNLNCKYCYATDRIESDFPRMTLEEYKLVVDELCELSPYVKFSLTGGEPLLNKECIEIGRYIKSKGHYVDLLTNATLIDEKIASQIAAIFDKVTISMDGSSKELHELFRGPNTYELTNRNIDLLISKGIDTHLSMTVNRLNIHDVADMAKKYGNLLSYAPLFPAGNANKTENDISITGEEYYKALADAEGVNPLSYCETSYENAKECRNCKCAIGDCEISISATGDVYPCQLLHYPEFYIGNIHESSIKDLYLNSDVIEKCRSITVDNIEECSKCFLKYVCGGACRARSFHECGDIFRSGKFCEYEKNAFLDGLLDIYSENIL